MTEVEPLTKAERIKFAEWAVALGMIMPGQEILDLADSPARPGNRVYIEFVREMIGL